MVIEVDLFEVDGEKKKSNKQFMNFDAMSLCLHISQRK